MFAPPPPRQARNNPRRRPARTARPPSSSSSSSSSPPPRSFFPAPSQTRPRPDHVRFSYSTERKVLHTPEAKRFRAVWRKNAARAGRDGRSLSSHLASRDPFRVGFPGVWRVPYQGDAVPLVLPIGACRLVDEWDGLPGGCRAVVNGARENGDKEERKREVMEAVEEVKEGEGSSDCRSSDSSSSGSSSEGSGVHDRLLSYLSARCEVLGSPHVHGVSLELVTGSMAGGPRYARVLVVTRSRLADRYGYLAQVVFNWLASEGFVDAEDAVLQVTGDAELLPFEVEVVDEVRSETVRLCPSQIPLSARSIWESVAKRDFLLWARYEMLTLPARAVKTANLFRSLRQTDKEQGEVGQGKQKKRSKELVVLVSIGYTGRRIAWEEVERELQRKLRRVMQDDEVQVLVQPANCS